MILVADVASCGIFRNGLKNKSNYERRAQVYKEG